MNKNFRDCEISIKMIIITVIIKVPLIDLKPVKILLSSVYVDNIHTLLLKFQSLRVEVREE